MSSMNPQNSPIVRPGGAPAAARKPRADGVQSRQAILLAAARLVTTRGLEGLSVGELARHIGMSKSGLYTHFKSKEDLELATIETAAEIFDREVLQAVARAPAGARRLHWHRNGCPYTRSRFVFSEMNFTSPSWSASRRRS